MADDGQPSNDNSSGARLVEALPQLFAQLRAALFDVGTEQYLSACDLLVQFNAHRHRPGRDELRASLAAIFSTSSAEQTRFAELFNSWYAAPIHRQQPEPQPDKKTLLTWIPISRRDRWRSLLLAIGGCFVLVVAVWIYDYFQRPPVVIVPPTATIPPPVPPTVITPPEKSPQLVLSPRQPPEAVIPPAEFTPLWVGPSRWLWLAPVLAWLSWTLSRLLLRHVVLKRRRARKGEEYRLDSLKLAGDKGELFSTAVLAETWRHLRRFKSMRSQRLNEAATIDRTLEAGGFFRPVYRERQVPPAYLYLVDRRHGEDHAASIADELGDALRRENIQVAAFNFDEDPRYCTPAREIASERSPSALAGVYGDRDLLLAGDGDALFDYATGAPQHWFDQFASFGGKVMLTTDPVWRQSQRFDPLTEAGFRLLPLTPIGIGQLGTTKDEIGYDDPRDLPLPRRFTVNPRYWLEERTPKRGTLDAPIRELREYLGTDGFLLLCGTAAYPGIYWRLTRALDAQFDLSEADRALRLRKLARLPWFRYGRMPDYLRVALLRSLSRADFDRVTSTINALIDHRNDVPLQLPVAIPDWQRARRELRATAQASARHEPLADHVFADVVCGRKPRLLELRLTRPADFSAGQLSWSGVGLPLFTGLVMLPTAIWLNLWVWQSWLGPLAARESSARMTERHQSVRVGLQSLPRLRPVSDALDASLQGWGFRTEPVASASSAVLTVEEQKLLDQVAQASPEPKAIAEVVSSGPNRVIYRDGKLDVAKVISARVSYVFYGVEPQLEESKGDLASGVDIVIELRDFVRGFRDPIVDSAKHAKVQQPIATLLARSKGFREKGQYLDAIVELRKARVLDPSNLAVIRELDQINKVCVAEKTLGVPIDCGEPEMITIPAVPFLMGDIQKVGDKNELPVHTVQIRKSFALSRFEVTFDEYDSFARATGRQLPSDKGWGRGRRPVINVSWEDAQAYVKWLSEQTGKRYRLPTEAEWEYAARAGTQTKYWWGDNFRNGAANCDSCGSQWDKKQTAPVGSFKANGFALHDMAGNVWEWIEDCWHNNYNGAPTDGRAWRQENGGQCGPRVVRGGSWGDRPGSLRSSNRGWSGTVDRSNSVGFRLAQDLP